MPTYLDTIAACVAADTEGNGETVHTLLGHLRVVRGRNVSWDNAVDAIRRAEKAGLIRVHKPSRTRAHTWTIYPPHQEPTAVDSGQPAGPPQSPDSTSDGGPPAPSFDQPPASSPDPSPPDGEEAGGSSFFVELMRAENHLLSRGISRRDRQLDDIRQALLDIAPDQSERVTTLGLVGVVGAQVGALKSSRDTLNSALNRIAANMRERIGPRSAGWSLDQVVDTVLRGFEKSRGRLESLDRIGKAVGIDVAPEEAGSLQVLVAEVEHRLRIADGAREDARLVDELLDRGWTISDLRGLPIRFEAIKASQRELAMALNTDEVRRAIDELRRQTGSVDGGIRPVNDSSIERTDIIIECLVAVRGGGDMTGATDALLRLLDEERAGRGAA